MTSRVIAAIFGGYVLTSLFAIAGALLLSIVGVNKAEAGLATTMGSFLIYAATSWPYSTRAPHAEHGSAW